MTARTRSPLRLTLQIAVPVLLLALGALLAYLIAQNRKPPIVVTPTFEGPLVRTATVTVGERRIDVTTQGSVEPFREVDLVPQVGGRIVRVSDRLRAGAFVDPDEVLVQIDPTDHRLAIAQHEANVARAELRLVQERAEAEASVRAWRELEGERPADPLVRRVPQIADAEKSLQAAKAQLERAQLDLQRTELRAPFAARVRSANAEIGQLAAPGQPLAQLFDLAAVEVRLPIPSTDAAFLDLPMYRDGQRDRAARVVLHGEFAGRRHEWLGHVVRTEGELDRRTRQLTVVAAVADPYARGETAERPPLTIGMFVSATIEGRTFPAVAAVPRVAVSQAGEVWVVDAEHRLRRRQVELLRAEGEQVLVAAGLAPGETVVTSPLQTPHEGMPVRIAATAAAEGGK